MNPMSRKWENNAEKHVDFVVSIIFIILLQQKTQMEDSRHLVVLSLLNNYIQNVISESCQADVWTSETCKRMVDLSYCESTKYKETLRKYCHKACGYCRKIFVCVSNNLLFIKWNYID